MRKDVIKNIAVYSMGIALFVVLSLCLQVPVFQNYYLCLGYVAMTLFCYSVSITGGILSGTLGVVIYCMLINGLRGMPGWAIGNLFLGIVMGITFKAVKKINKPIIETIISSIVIVIGTAIAMLGLKSSVECLLYSQPFWVRVTTNIPAFITDALIIIISIPICRILEPHVKKILKKM